MAYRGMRFLDYYPIEIMISLSLSLVTGTYAVAQKLGVSGSVAVVAAGLLIGMEVPAMQ